MKASLFYKVAAVLLVLFALGHTFGFRKTDPSWGADSVVASMKSIHFYVQGFNRSYWDFFVGFGLFATVFLLFSAVLAWELSVMNPQTLVVMPVVRWGFAICFVGITVLSYRYFFLAPMILSPVITLCLILSAWLSAQRT